MVPQPDLQGATAHMSAEEVQGRLERKAEELKNDGSLSQVRSSHTVSQSGFTALSFDTQEEREARLKEEKMRIGIEKMKLAHKKKVAIKVFNPDRSNKTGEFLSPLSLFSDDEAHPSLPPSVVVEEGMTSGMVCHLLVVKNHFDESPNWVLVEQLGDVSLGRLL